MDERFSRTELLIGKQNLERLAKSRVAVFGLGGVGGYVVEVLARSGIGALDLIDNDRVSLTNLNRQILALNSTLGKLKINVAEERIKEINPECKVKTYNLFYTPESACGLDFKEYDYIVDAIDTVSGKISLAEQAEKANIPIISCMGAGNKLDPTAFEVADIYSTSVCPLARVMRSELRKRGIKSLKVVYSKEQPISLKGRVKGEEHILAGEKMQFVMRPIPASNSIVPAAEGLIAANEVIKDLFKTQ